VTDQKWPADDYPAFAVRVLAAASLGVLCGAGPVLFVSGGVFVTPIADDTGWSREIISGAIGLTSIIFGFMSPITGALADRFQPRTFALVSMPALGVGMILLGLVPRSAESFVAMIVMAALLGSGQMPHAYALATAKWFERHRGLALGIVMSCTGLSLAIVAPSASLLIESFGWRTAYVSIGCAVGLLGLVAAILMVNPPKDGARTTSSDGLSWREAGSTRRFWVMFSSFLLIALSVGGGVVHLPSIIAAKGIESSHAATALSMLGIAAVLTRISYGYLLDIFFAPRISALVFLAPALSYAVLISSDGTAEVYIGAILLGVGLGAETDALSYIASRAFGMINYGKIFGILFFAIGFGSGAAPYLFAKLATAFAGYFEAMILGAILSVISAALMLSLSRGDLPFRSAHGRDVAGS
jgi:MFS transporter, OFA family, oxalate/formate antiporter